MKKILIVDDEKDTIYSIKKGLESLGKEYNYEEAHSGKEAIEKLKTNNYDLTILDLNLGDTDGMVIASMIKNDSKIKNMPIIFLTGYDNSMRNKWGSSMSKAYLTKPFKIEQLSNNIEKFI